MQVEEVDEEEEGGEEVEEELKKKPNPGYGPCFKVIVTNENGLQASNPNRWVVISELVFSLWVVLNTKMPQMLGFKLVWSYL